jgi:hypothetical protein
MLCINLKSSARRRNFENFARCPFTFVSNRERINVHTLHQKTNAERKQNYMSTAVSSLNPASLYWQLMAMWKASHHHGYLNQTQAPQQAVADQIILLVNLKQVASKVKGADAVVKGVSAAITSAIDGVFNGSEPGDDTPTGVSPWIFHWPWPPPGPYLVAAQLTQYATLLNDETAQEEFSEIINAFAARLAGATAATS